MKASRRIQTLVADGDDGWSIYREARRMRDAGLDVIELTIGEHDRRTEPNILTAMYKAATGGHTGYPSIPGTDALRDKVAARISERTGVPTNRGNVMIVPGGQAGLFAAHMAACDPGDIGLFIDPYYATYPGTIRAAGAVAKSVPAHAANGFQPDASDLRDAANGARSLLINSPNNPTGVIYSAECLDGIASVVRDHDLWLISDEVYDTQLWAGQHLSPRQLPDMAPRTLVVGSVSKSHAMTGSRLGWVVGPEHIIANLANLATHTTYGVAGFIQDAALFALSQGKDFETRISEPFRRRHRLAKTLLDKAGVPVVPSLATMYLMADIRKTGLTGIAFAEKLLGDHRIAVMPGESFGQSSAGHVRIALTVADDRLTDALSTMVTFYQTETRSAHELS